VRVFLMLLKYSLAAIFVTTVFGGVGMMLGGVIARIINPRPNPHLMEGVEYVMGGAMIGALLGLAAVIALAVQENKRRRQRSIQSEQTS
jgi:zinc transporter ZupT